MSRRQVHTSKEQIPVSELEQITAAAQAAVSAIDAAKTTAQAAVQEAYDLAYEAASHGWEGVAATVQAAHDDLEAVVSSLAAGYDAADAAVNATQEITSKMKPTEVSERLGAVLSQLDQATTAVESADGSAVQAQGHSERAEADRLTGMISGVSDDLGGARQAITDTKTKAETERQVADSYGK